MKGACLKCVDLYRRNNKVMCFMGRFFPYGIRGVSGSFFLL